MPGNIKLVCFDLNKTLIRENTWYDLNLAMGMTARQDKKYLNLYNAGKLSYRAWVSTIVKIYTQSKLATREGIMKIITRYTYRAGVRDTIKYLQGKGYKVALVSGSMDLLVDHVAAELEIGWAGSNNRFVFGKNGRLTAIRCLGDDEKAKLRLLQNICCNLNIQITECACVGDGDNDSLMFKACDHGITFAGSKLEPQAWKVISKLSDLKTIFA